MTPAGTSNELDVQNEWEEYTHTHMDQPGKVANPARGQLNREKLSEIKLFVRSRQPVPCLMANSGNIPVFTSVDSKRLMIY